MPLMHGKSDKAFSKNVSTEMNSGRPQKQALAIAYATKRAAQKKAKGGMVSSAEELKKAADYELSKENEIDSTKVMPGEGVSKDDMGRDEDQSPHTLQHSEDNEMLHPTMEPNHIAENLLRRREIARNPQHEEDHDEMTPEYADGGMIVNEDDSAEQQMSKIEKLYHTKEHAGKNDPSQELMQRARADRIESLVHKSGMGDAKGYYARGGLMEPKHVAVMIMHKKAHGGLAYGQGGMVNDGDEELHGDEEKYVAIDRMPSNPWNEIEGDGELREKMKKRSMLQGIMSSLHTLHKGI